MPIVVLSALTACGVFSTAEVEIKRPPDVLMTPAPALQSDPGGALTQAQVEILWGRDRSAGRVAMERHAGLVAWVEDLLGAAQN